MGSPLHEDDIRDFIKDRIKKIFAPILNREFQLSHTAIRSNEESWIGVEFNESYSEDLVVNINLMSAGSSYRQRQTDSFDRWHTVSFQRIGGFQIKQLDGGYTVVISNAWLSQFFQNKGYGVKLHKLRLEAIKKAKLPSVIATSNSNNAAQNKIFRFFGWQQIVLDPEHLLWYIDMTKYTPRKISNNE